MDELKPCPFCGGNATSEHPENARWSVGCSDIDGDCMGFQSLQTFARKAEAITAWNTRSPVTDEMVERAVLAILKAQRDLGADPLSWEDATDEQKSGCKTAMHAALTAALGGPHG